MKALLLKDCYVITKQLKIFLIAMLILAFWGGSSLNLMALFIASMLPMTAIAYDENSKWNDFASMLPYTKKDMVISKYILSYICLFVATVLVGLGSVISKIFFIKDMQIEYMAIVVSVILVLAITAINMFIFLKIGVEKGRLFFIILMVCTSIFGGDLANLLPPLSVIVMFLCVVILNIVSIMFSLRIKNNK